MCMGWKKAATMICMIWILAAIFLLPVPPSAAAEGNDLGRAQLELLCALVSMSSYDDEINLIVRHRLQEMGWEYEPFWEKSNAANTNTFLVHRNIPDSGQEIYILAFPGTSSVKDAEVDLRMHRVPFGGASPQEFLEFAQRKDLNTASYPFVHQGFNDYTWTALFKTPLKDYGNGNETLGEIIAGKLCGEPERKLILTGHSLGGAVAVLAAARLADMGVAPEQMDVITFGSPAVGNESFARRYETRFPLSRIVIDGDPVQGAIQSVHGGYVQFGSRIDRKQNRNSKLFAHSIAVYLDDALRNFYDARKDAGELSTHYLENCPSVAARVYVPYMDIQMDKEIAGDESYMREAVKDIICGRISQPVFGEEPEKAGLSALCEKGKSLGCDYVLVEDFRGTRIKQERDNFQIMMEEMLYDVDGHLMEMQSNSTTTKKMTPLEAAIYVQMAGRESREEAMERHSTNTLPK